MAKLFCQAASACSLDLPMISMAELTACSDLPSFLSSAGVPNIAEMVQCTVLTIWISRCCELSQIKTGAKASW